jgi:hypothetical protein
MHIRRQEPTAFGKAERHGTGIRNRSFARNPLNKRTANLKTGCDGGSVLRPFNPNTFLVKYLQAFRAIAAA